MYLFVKNILAFKIKNKMIKSNLAFNKRDINHLIIKIIKGFVVILVLMMTETTYAQEVHSRITLLKGASVPISFDSYNKMYSYNFV